jgi:hypothetical protein
MKKWNEANPGRAKEAMTQVCNAFNMACTRIHTSTTHILFISVITSVSPLIEILQIALMWKDAPENPNRGQESKPRKPKEPKAPKEKAPAKPRTKKTAAKSSKVSEEEEAVEGDEEPQASGSDD